MKPIWPIALILSILLNACSQDNSDTSALQTPIKVRAFKIQSSENTLTEQVPGTVRSRMRSLIESKISGRIEELPIVEGKSVEAGELLVKLDAQEIKAKVSQAQAASEQSNKELQRFGPLLEKGAVTQSEFDAIKAKALMTKAALEEAQTMLGYTTLTAPFKGVINRKNANVGDMALPGKVLLEIEDPSVLRFEAAVPESFLPGLSIGKQLKISLSQKEYSGEIEEISPAADQNSRTFPIKISLPQDPAIRSGQFGHALLPTGIDSEIYVPMATVIRRGQLELVYTVKDQRAALRIVRTGKQNSNGIQILAGLEAGDLVIIGNQSDLSEGQLLEIQ